MDGEHSFLENPDGTQEEIMQATYRALCEHGYADLTIQRIGDHFEKSKSLLYHHYDSKDELLLDFLSFMLEEFQQSIPAPENDPESHITKLMDAALATDLPATHREFESAMAELRAQAATDDRYREHFTRHDEFFHDQLSAVVEAGIENGTFREVDPERVATFVLALLDGVRTRRATSDAGDVEAVRAELETYLDAVLYAE